MISIVNAGRGSGKTYALIQWAKESDNRFVVGLNTYTGDAFEEAGIHSKFVHFSDARDFFATRPDAEIAIDSVEKLLPTMLSETYGIDPYAHEVMLVGVIADVTDDLIPNAGFKLLDETLLSPVVAEYMKKLFGMKEEK